MVILISALSSLLYYWRILPLVVRGLSWALERAMGIGGALGVSTVTSHSAAPARRFLLRHFQHGQYPFFRR